MTKSLTLKTDTGQTIEITYTEDKDFLVLRIEGKGIQMNKQEVAALVEEIEYYSEHLLN